jgi:chromatin modification-related protein VID21
MAAGNIRMSPQQMAHVQAQAIQARAMAQAQATQVQAQNAASALNGAMGSSHLSPPYVARTASSSPGIQQASPPRNSVTPSNANNPPRPPSAQMIPVPGNAAPRPMSNMGHYFAVAPNMQGQITQEQVEQAMQLRNLLQVCPLARLFCRMLNLSLAAESTGGNGSGSAKWIPVIV